MFFKGYSKIIDIFSFFLLYVLTSAFCNVTLRGQCKRLGFKNVVPLKWPWRRKMSLNWNEHKNNKKKLWKNDKSVYFMWIFKNLDLCTFRFLCKQIPRSFLFPLKYFKPFEFVKKKKKNPLHEIFKLNTVSNYVWRARKKINPDAFKSSWNLEENKRIILKSLQLCKSRYIYIYVLPLYIYLAVWLNIVKYLRDNRKK